MRKLALLAVVLAFSQVLGQDQTNAPKVASAPAAGVLETAEANLLGALSDSAEEALEKQPKLSAVLGTVPSGKNANALVTFKTSPEGIELLTALRNVATQAGYGFVHAKDLPNPKVQVSIEKRPFREAWPALIYGILGPEYDFAVTDRVILVAKKEALEELLRKAQAELPSVQAPSPVTKTLNAPEESEALVKGFFPDLRVFYAKDSKVLVLRGPAPRVEEAVALVEAVSETSVKPSEKEARFLETSVGEATLTAIKALGLEAYNLQFGVLLIGDEKALDRAQKVLDQVDQARKAVEKEKSQASPSRPVLKVYRLPKAAQGALEALRKTYGDLAYSPETGLLYAVLLPEEHTRLEKDLALILEETGKVETRGLQSVPGETLLNYNTQMPPSTLAQTLTPLFPEAQFVAVDSTRTLVVKAAPEVQVRVAETIKRLDKPTEADLEKRRQEEEKAKKESATALYKARYVPVKTLANLFTELQKTSQGSGAQGAQTQQGEGQTKAKEEAVQAAANPSSNTVVLKGPRSEVEEALKVLSEMDRPPEQVRLRVTIYQVRENAGEDLGINWSSNTSGLSLAYGADGTAVGLNLTGAFGPISNLAKLTANLNLLASKGAARKVMDTTILALNGTEVSLLSGGTFTVITASSSSGENMGNAKSSSSREYEFGLVTKATPIVLGDESVLLSLDVELGELPTAGPVPDSFIIGKTKTSTALRIPQGVTAILGGVLGVERTRDEKGIPVLKDIPLLGNLFKQTETQEIQQTLLILITPELVAEVEPKETKPKTTTDLPKPAWQEESIRRFQIGK